MSTTKDMIKVMQAHEDGMDIEVRGFNGSWMGINDPVWNWGTSKYRIKQLFHDSIPAILKNAIENKEEVVFLPSSREQSKAIQELIFELGVSWVGNVKRTQLLGARLFIGYAHAGYAIYTTSDVTNLHLDTGEYTPAVVEMTMSEINKHFGKNVKIVK